MSESFTLLGKMAGIFSGDRYAEQVDRIRTVQGSDPDHNTPRRDRSLRHRLGMLATSAVGEPHLRHRGYIGQHVQAMHNLRNDRSVTNRLLNSDAPMDAVTEKYVHGLRDIAMPAMQDAFGKLARFEFPQKTLAVSLDRNFKLLTGLQEEFWDNIVRPKASRRADLAKDYIATTAELIATLDKFSMALAVDINQQDATIDQCSRSDRWPGARSTAGDASVLVSSALARGHAGVDARLSYAKTLADADAP